MNNDNEMNNAQSAHTEGSRNLWTHAESRHAESRHAGSRHDGSTHAGSKQVRSNHAESTQTESSRAQSRHAESTHAESTHAESTHKRWEEVYLLAALEVDRGKMPDRIAAVKEAIRARLQELEKSSDHHTEWQRLADALQTLKVLETESRKW